jgi:hypothetical protein
VRDLEAAGHDGAETVMPRPRSPQPARSFRRYGGGVRLVPEGASKSAVHREPEIEMIVGAVLDVCEESWRALRGKPRDLPEGEAEIARVRPYSITSSVRSRSEAGIVSKVVSMASAALRQPTGNVRDSRGFGGAGLGDPGRWGGGAGFGVGGAGAGTRSFRFRRVRRLLITISASSSR